MLRDKIINQIREHAANDYPNEACGLIVAVRKSQRYIRCRNAHPEPAEHFQIDPRDYADAEDAGRVLAVVHSHPDATSRPSRMDSAQCDAGGLPWYIMSWPEGDLRRVEPGVWPRPLIGREYLYNVQDCYSIVQDWHEKNRGVRPDRPDSSDGWWDAADTELILDNLMRYGWCETDKLEIGDMIVMQCEARVANHCAVYIGGNQMLHHMPGRLSAPAVYGGYWQERTRAIVRYEGE